MLYRVFFFFKQKTAYEMLRSLVGSEMCIRDSKLGKPVHLAMRHADHAILVGSRDQNAIFVVDPDLSLIHI